MYFCVQYVLHVLYHSCRFVVSFTRFLSILKCRTGYAIPVRASHCWILRLCPYIQGWYLLCVSHSIVVELLFSWTALTTHRFFPGLLVSKSWFFTCKSDLRSFLPNIWAWFLLCWNYTFWVSLFFQATQIAFRTNMFLLLTMSPTFVSATGFASNYIFSQKINK